MPVRFVITRSDCFGGTTPADKFGVFSDIQTAGKNPPRYIIMHIAETLGIPRDELNEFLNGYRDNALTASVVFLNNNAFWPGSIGAFYARHHLRMPSMEGHSLSRGAQSHFSDCNSWRDYYYRGAFAAFEEFAKRQISHIWIEMYDAARNLNTLAHAAKDVGLQNECSFDLEADLFLDGWWRDQLPTSEDMELQEYRPFDRHRIELATDWADSLVQIDFSEGLCRNKG